MGSDRRRRFQRSSLLLARASFYLSGVSPRDFQQGDALQVKVNKLSSPKTPFSYDFYYLNYWKPKKIRNITENLGEVLRGDLIENSVCNFSMREEQSYKVACKVTLDAQAAKKLEENLTIITGSIFSTVNYEFKNWDEKNPKVSTCSPNTKNLIQGGTVPQEVDAGKDVVFTYGITFKEGCIKWASRWGIYLLMNDDQIHRFSIINF